jgi:hypothetical protein
MKVRAITLLLLAIALNSCLYDKVSPSIAYKIDANCADSLQYSYNAHIKPIITTYCYSCHSTSVIAQAGGGLDLENYTTLVDYMSTDFQGDQVFGSMFYHCLLKSQGAKAMPPSNEKLSRCELTKIKHWLDKGAPND